MPLTPPPGTRRSPAARERAAGPSIERVVPFAFTAADSGGNDTRAYRDHVESVYGALPDFSWLEDGTAVSYHDMARVIARELAAELADVDLVITVDASPDCRHQSFPSCLLSDLMPGDPMLLGISEQGVAGPFTALRVAYDRLADGSSRRALVLVMEQSTLPPDDRAVRPARDVAVALLLGPDGAIPLERPVVTVDGLRAADGRRTAGAPEPAEDGSDGPYAPRADGIVAGAGLTGPLPDTVLARAEPGHPCAGVWLALAGLLERADGRPGGRVLIADRDPVLPYHCGLLLTLPAGRAPARVAPRRKELVP
ncbi:hypothetical protein [Streptomyces sp. IB2014 016-6]|uniref:hypothetical protein n=1 Tax=Streptomyces sp. IB2014 016-6 TaxID=2517818 RepID=UPI0011C93731|nr:hypothetical protein [Streptomyces sp. IB2014 016-6]TXL89753.1 hypothetical protein EW053_11970 [Streptomyces sp. IB2014 016-6]